MSVRSESKRVPTHRVESLLERLYARAGARYMDLLFYAVLVLYATLVAALTPLLVHYFGASRVEMLGTLAFNVSVVLVVYRFVAVPRLRRVAEPITTWIRSEVGDEASTVNAWSCARSLTLEGARVLFVIICVGMVVPILINYVVVYELSLAEAVASLFFVFFAVGGWLLVVAWFSVELLLRPVRRDLAQHVVMLDEAGRVHHIPLRVKLLGTASAVSWLTGWAVAVATTLGSGNILELGRLGALTLLIAAVTGAAPILLFARSLTAPVDDLLAATERVGAGDLAARADVTSDDEIAALAVSFNDMVASLERASSEVRASRARIVAASDAERRRIERNIHDGAQQKLVALALQLRMVQDHVEDPELRAQVEAAVANLQDALEELRELARGLHPSVLSTDGLRPALEQLVDKASVPVSIDAPTERYPEAAESTAYFVASEALANVTKHAQATSAKITVAHHDGHLALEVTDDGVGGASVGSGSGLTGLTDRVEAVGGTFSVASSPTGGTTVRAALPIDTTARGPGAPA